MTDKWTIDVNLKGATSTTMPKVDGIADMLKGTSGIMSSFGNILKKTLQSLGLASIILIVVQLVAQSKQLVNILTKLVQMIGILLSPIADVITAILYPILLIIKPIAMAVKQIMMPFTRLAMEMFKKMVEEGSAGAGILAVSALLSGLTSVIIVLFNEVFKLVGGMLISTIGGIIGIFFPTVGEHIQTAGVQAFNSAMDSFALIAVTNIAGSLVQLGNMVGIDTSNFTRNMGVAIDSVFINLDEKTLTEAKNLLTLLESEDIGFGEFTLKTAYLASESFITIGNTMSFGIGFMFEDITNYINAALINISEFARTQIVTEKNLVFRAGKAAGEWFADRLIDTYRAGQRFGDTLLDTADRFGLRRTTR